MKNNAEVKAAYEEAQKTLEDLASVQSITPPAELKSKIWNKIQQEQTTLETSDSSTKIQTTQLKSINWQKYAIAASVLFLISIIGNFFWINDISRNKKEIARLETEKQSQNLALQNIQQKWEISSDPNILKVALNGVEKHPESKAVVFWNKANKNVYLRADNLPKAPAGMQYQLWALVDGKPVSAGMYTTDKDSRVVLANIPKAQAFAITLEKEGGVESPTMENMFVIGTI